MKKDPLIQLLAVGVLCCFGCGQEQQKARPVTKPDSPATQPAEDLTKYEGIEIKTPDTFEGEFATPGVEVGLEIGQLAPEITGTDFAGTEFKLSDYRGKLVVLFFWGDWCLSCNEIFPQMRQLARKNLDKHFAIVGVNNEDDLESAQKAAADKKLIWRSFYDGHRGPIAALYQIQFYPSLVVIDENGIVQQRSSSDVENLLENLLSR